MYVNVNMLIISDNYKHIICIVVLQINMSCCVLLEYCCSTYLFVLKTFIHYHSFRTIDCEIMIILICDIIANKILILLIIRTAKRSTDEHIPQTCT